MTLKELRESRALTQTEVGAQCEVTAQTVSLWERGATSPRPQQIRKLAALFNLSIAEIKEIIKESGGNPD